MRGKQILLWGCILLLCFSGCKQQEEKVQEVWQQEEKGYQIGLSFDSFVIERWLRDRDAFVSTAQELGAQVNVQNANGSLNEQISQLEYFIQKKMDVIVVVAVDCNGLGQVIEKAKKEGIKVISYDRLIVGTTTDLYLSFDNELVGKEMAQSIQTALPQGGNIACIMGPKSDNNVELIKKGFEQSIAENENITIAYQANCENWDADLAPKYVEEAIVNVSNLSAIMCGNDDIATQVTKTLAEYRLGGKVIVVGQDADLSACQRIVQGTQTMTVFKHVEELAKMAAEYAVELAKGENITSEEASLGCYTKTTISSGNGDIPYQALEPVVVMESNMKEIIIDSGFHEESEVYLNMGK